MTGRRFSVIVVVAAAVVAAGMAAVALAHGVPGNVANSATVRAFHPGTDLTYPTKTAKVACPSGFSPRNAGWAGDVDPDFFAGNAEVLPQAMRYKGGTWKVQGSNEGESSGQIAAIQLCSAKRALEMRAVKKTKKLKPGTKTTVTATCPKGTEVLGGGFDSGTAATMKPSSFVYGTKRTSNRRWRVYTEFPSPAKAWLQKGNPRGTVSSIAYCGRGPQISVASHAATVQYGQTNFANATCPPGTSVLFGAAKGSLDFANLTGVFPDASAASSAHAWSAEGVNFAFGPKGTPSKITAYAYCA